jgi:predicted dehydrogenase
METSVARCDAIIAACERAGVTLCLAQVVRFRGSPRRGKEIIDAGTIGQVQQIHQHWRFAANPAGEKPWTLDPVHGGVFLDAGAHTFDLMRWYAGAEATRVYGVVTRFSDRPWVKPTAMVLVTFANGVIGNLWLTYELPEPGFADAAFRTQVVGSNGLLNVDAYGKVEVTIDGAWRTIWEQPPIDYTHSYLNPTRLEAFAAELQDFIDSVRGGRVPFATGADGRAAVEMVEAANRSSQTGEAIRLSLEG